MEGPGNNDDMKKECLDNHGSLFFVDTLYQAYDVDQLLLSLSLNASFSSWVATPSSFVDETGN